MAKFAELAEPRKAVIDRLQLQCHAAIAQLARCNKFAELAAARALLQALERQGFEQAAKRLTAALEVEEVENGLK